MAAAQRTETDSIGEISLAKDTVYGIQTARALENFPITHVRISHFSTLVNALASVKSACARANVDMGVLDVDRGEVIIAICDEILNGRHHEHFVVDVIQGGAGTSTNMNANEVIANLGLARMGHAFGEYAHLHPNDHVNRSQSTNDVYPTAIRCAILMKVGGLCDALAGLKAAFDERGKAFDGIAKIGRTQLQDAVPMSLGMEFAGFAVTVGEDIDRIREVGNLLKEVNLGGTAIGTGINAEPGYGEKAVEYLREATGLPFVLAPNLVEATQDTGAFVIYSSAVKRLAVKLSKICNDLRLLSSGPRAGINEINLPKMQPGSSIMPGKVNPVIPEVVNQIAFKVIGNDLTVTMAAEAGQLELNVMEPVIAECIFESIEMLKNGMATLKHRCVDGITANVRRCRAMVERSIGLVTALNPVLGYETCTTLARIALEEDRSVYDLVLERGLLSREELDRLLVDRLEVEPLGFATERDAQPVHDQRPAMRNRNATANAGRAEVFASLEHLEQHALGLLIKLEEPDQLLEHFVLGRALKLELDGIFGKELAQFHSRVW